VKRVARASAPSNIALIKYMGKRDASRNLPANPSLSLTLESLRTYVEISRDSSENGTHWIHALPEFARDASARLRGPFRHAENPEVPILSEAGVSKVIRHVERLRAALPALLASHGLECDPSGGIGIRSANTFPSASGIASSASSFAALTLACAAAMSADPDELGRAFARDESLRRELSALSRLGSGSSCRSIEGPWVLWEGESASPIETRMPELVDIVLLIAAGPKLVSSSQAHAQVTTSPLWDGRVERVVHRLETVEAALGEGDLNTLARTAWAEMWEMHSLFHTCSEPFTYWEPMTIEALNWLSPHLRVGNPPIVTLDAGPNVHVLVPLSDAGEWEQRIRTRFPRLPLLIDTQGRGARIERGA
jgi:diphosphomevalonate decarboxylase